MIYSFRPLKREPRQREILAFDVEGVGGPDGFVCGAIVGAITNEFYTDRAAMWSSLLAHGANGAWILAHNLEYDLPIVAADQLLQGDLIFKKRGILKATYQHWGRKATLYDSLGLFPRWSVEDLGELVGRVKLKAGREFVKAISGGARWRDFTPEDQELLRTYCERDASIVYHAVRLLQETLLELGGELRSTIAGCSMDLFRRKYMQYAWRTLGPETNDLARPAFYGGRTENFAIGTVEGVNLYDINSLYPNVQGGASYPHPSHLELIESPRISYALDRMQGVAHARVTVPDMYLPVLPCRIQKRLFFPTGEIEGAWTVSELKAAAERGITIERLDWVLGTDTTYNPFHEFVEDLYRKRLGDLASGSSRQLVLKLILNSLYGRFGLDPKEGLWQMVPLPARPNWEDFRGWSTSEVNGQVVAYGPLQGLNYPAYANVLFAAETAARARLELLEGLEEQGENAVYCDTDSIMTRGELPTGDLLGEWKLQMQNGTADLLGPKEYVLHNLVFGDRYVVKGVPEDVARSWIETGTARFRRALKIREAIDRRRNPSEWVEVFRSHNPTLPKRQPSLTPFDQQAPFVLTLPWPRPTLVELAKTPGVHYSAARKGRKKEHYPVWLVRAAEQLGLDPELLRTAEML